MLKGVVQGQSRQALMSWRSPIHTRKRKLLDMEASEDPAAEAIAHYTATFKSVGAPARPGTPCPEF